MEEHKKIRDIMEDIFKFPHIPYWFTVKQSIGIIKHAFLESHASPYVMEVLVFEEQYNLVGTLSLNDILKALEPRFMQVSTRAQGYSEEVEEVDLSVIWAKRIESESIELSQRAVGDYMTPVKYFVEPHDPVTKAAYLMIHHDLQLLPVLENKKKLLGIVRIIDIFNYIAEIVLSKRKE
jgi:CBS domain-containing protein